MAMNICQEGHEEIIFNDNTETLKRAYKGLRQKKLAKMSINELELPVRAHNALRNNNIFTVLELVTLTSDQLRKEKRIGVKVLFEIKLALLEKGLFLDRLFEENVCPLCHALDRIKELEKLFESPKKVQKI